MSVRSERAGRAKKFLALGAGVASALVLMLAAGLASADAPFPLVLSVSSNSSITLNAGVKLTGTSAWLRGSWQSVTALCAVKRNLRITALVTHGSRQAQRIGTFATKNCPTGFPARGFTLSAKSLGFGCRDGAWRAGSYTFSTLVDDLRTGFSTRAVLRWTSRGC
jgi:hypothetical protein